APVVVGRIARSARIRLVTGRDDRLGSLRRAGRSAVLRGATDRQRGEGEGEEREEDTGARRHGSAPVLCAPSRGRAYEKGRRRGGAGPRGFHRRAAWQPRRSVSFRGTTAARRTLRAAHVFSTA